MISSVFLVAYLTHAFAIRISTQDVINNKARASIGSLGCLDPSGKPVDFWYSFKYPGGWSYAYMDSNHKLETMPGTLEDDEGGKSPLAQTLDQLYEKKTELSYALWNDQPPNSGAVAAPKAHAKGVLAMAQTGFWLTHSVPLFPQEPHRAKDSKSSFPGAKAPTNGQSFLCISIGKGAIPELMKLFETDWMPVYDSADNAGLGGEFEEWAMKSKHADAKNTSTSHYVTTVTSQGGQGFTAFSKSAALGDDLYEALVAPHFKKDFIAETWQNGVGRIPTWKKGKQHAYTIENGAVVQFPGHDQFKESNDHSKWAVSMDGEVFCVGDINRQSGQTRRGGGTTCISDSAFAKQILDVIVEDEDGPLKHMEVDHESNEANDGEKERPSKRPRGGHATGEDSHEDDSDGGEPRAPKRTKRGHATEEDSDSMDVQEDEGPIAGRTRARTNKGA